MSHFENSFEGGRFIYRFRQKSTYALIPECYSNDVFCWEVFSGRALWSQRWIILSIVFNTDVEDNIVESEIEKCCNGEFGGGREDACVVQLVCPGRGGISLQGCPRPRALFSVSPHCDVLSYRLWRNPGVSLCRDFSLLLSGLLLLLVVDWLDDF